MLKGPRKVIAASTALAALTLGGLSPAPALALTGGDLTISGLPRTVVARDGIITLRATYNCVQYGEPYNGSDILLASITSTAAPGQSYDSLGPATYVVCDGTNRRITLTLAAVNGELSGPANLQFGHEAFTLDGSTGAISVYVDVPITVMIAGPKS